MIIHVCAFGMLVWIGPCMRLLAYKSDVSGVLGGAVVRFDPRGKSHITQRQKNPALLLVRCRVRAYTSIFPV